jgi:hypothetical protein
MRTTIKLGFLLIRGMALPRLRPNFLHPRWKEGAVEGSEGWGDPSNERGWTDEECGVRMCACISGSVPIEKQTGKWSRTLNAGKLGSLRTAAT